MQGIPLPERSTGYFVPLIVTGNVLSICFYRLIGQLGIKNKNLCLISSVYFSLFSYSENRDPSAPEFNHAKGYEVDLLKAIEAIPGSNMTFVFHGVKEWDNEESVFFVKIENKELIDKLNQYIDYLTNDGKIDYDAWTSNNNIFMERAKNYKKK